MMSGGKFANGARTFTFLHLITESARYYRSAVGREASALPGENRSGQNTYEIYSETGQQILEDAALNVVGINEALTGEFKDFFRQGGVLSKALNMLPTMNATAGLHDYWFNKPGGPDFNLFTNVATMLPAAAISTGAVIGNYTQDWTDSPALYLYLVNPREEY